MIQHQSFLFNPFQENTYLIWNSENHCVILDPGCSNRNEESELTSFIASNNLKPVAVWLSHCHIDHVLGLNFCIQEWGIPYYLHANEVSALKSVEVYAPVYSFHQYQAIGKPGIIPAGNEIKLGNEVFTILFVPGHSPGHLAFYHKASGQIWAGDVLFRESIGRTDLPGGDFQQLENSIRETLYKLPLDTSVYSGHGPETSIGHEKMFNPFVRG